MAATSRAGPNRDRSRDTDGGMVTIEAAVALCAFVTVLAMVLAGVSMVLDQIRCVDAAREAARLVARGEPDRAADAVRQIGPPRATLSITTNGDAITVVVQDPAGGGLLPGVHIRGEAYAIREPNDPDPTTSAPAAGDPTSAGPTNGVRTKTGVPKKSGGRAQPDDTNPRGDQRQVPADPLPDAGSGRSPRPTEGDRR